MTFFFLLRKGVYLVHYDTFSSFVMHSCPSASCVLWYIRVESVWLMLSGWLGSLPAVVSSRSHSSEAVESAEAGNHQFPSRLSGGLSLSALVEPALHTGIAVASRSFSSCCHASFHGKVTPEDSLLSCRCLRTVVSSFRPIFSVSHKVRIRCLWGNRSLKEGMIFPHRPHSYRVGSSIGCIGAALGSFFSGLN